MTELMRNHALELSAGSGQHSVHFAAALPGLAWQPTDIDPTAIASVAAHRAEAGLPNLLAPRVLDVTDADSVERAVARVVEREGRLDVVVNNVAYVQHRCYQPKSLININKNKKI